MELSVMQDLANHAPVAWERGEDVQALGSGEGRVWLLRRFAELMRKAATSDRLGLPDYRHPGGRSAHLLEFTGCCIPIAETKKLADKEPRISDAILDQLLGWRRCEERIRPERPAR